LSIRIKFDEPKSTHKVIDDDETPTLISKDDDLAELNSEIDDERAQQLVDGLFGFEIHNDAGGRSIEDEVTFLTLFPAINSLPEKFIKDAYKNIRKKCTFTENATTNYKKAKHRYNSLKTHPEVLQKIIKIWNHDYYESNFSQL
jgi:hypothetical protein